MNRIQIVNNALTALGSRRISSLNDTSLEEARVMNDIFDTVLEEVLTLHPWPSATSRKRLAQLNIENFTKWNFIYQIPNDVVWIISLLDPESFEELDLAKGSSRTSPLTVPLFEREGSYLYSNQEEVYIKYVKLPDDTKGLRDIIGKTVALKLSYETAIRLGRDVQLSQLLEQRYEMALIRARAADSIDGRLNYRMTKSWDECR